MIPPSERQTTTASAACSLVTVAPVHSLRDSCPNGTMSHKDAQSCSAIRSPWLAASIIRCQTCPLQERQRLETILSLCAEYNLEDGAAELAGAMTNGLLGGTTAIALDPGRGLSHQDVDKLQRLTENDEETLGEECSSTESTHQEVRNTNRSAGVCADLRPSVSKYDLSVKRCWPVKRRSTWRRRGAGSLPGWTT